MSPTYLCSLHPLLCHLLVPPLLGCKSSLKSPHLWHASQVSGRSMALSSACNRTGHPWELVGTG
jgi:hypothetical protein